MDSLIVTGGNLTSTVTGTITIRGNIALPCPPGTGSLRFLPASATTIRLAGNARQYMRSGPTCNNDQLFYMAPNVTLNVDNPAGVEFGYGYRTSGNISFTTGTINTPRFTDHPLIRYRISIDSTGTLTGAGASSGWVAAPLLRRVTTDGTLRLDIGDSLSYQPVDVTTHGVTAPGYVYAGTAPQDHWEVASSGLDPSSLAHRSWILWVTNDVFGNTVPTYLSSLDARFTFAPADVAPGADPLQFIARMWPDIAGDTWSSVAYSNRTSTSIDVTGILPDTLRHFPTFQIGEPGALDATDEASLAFSLAPVAPNPARATRNRISFVLPNEAKVKLTVFDLQGRCVATLADEVIPAGRHDRTWDATGQTSGVYFVRFEVPGFQARRRVTVLQ